MQMKHFPEAALERFRRCIEIGGEQAIVREYIGNMLVDRGRLKSGAGDEPAARADYEAAVAEYARAIALNPGRHYAWLGRGATLAYLGRVAEAAPDLRRALELARGERDEAAVAHLEDMIGKLGI
jgi:tetratricopeptide (TPR) repeat protein